MRKIVSIIVSGFFMCAFRAYATIDVTLQMQLGNPSGASADTNNYNHYLIQRTVEAIDYSDNLGEPVWASWDLTASDLGSSGRNTTYYTDTTLPLNFHPVTTADYNGDSAIDFNRGHLCDSDDRTDNTTDNKLVFYMTNIMPQSAPNNQGVWGTFEGYCRGMLTTNELLIICGPSGFGTNTIPSGKAYIGSNTWKVVVCVPLGNGTALSRLTVSNRVIAISVPNVTNGLSSAWQTYLTTPGQIEKDTGFTFFSAVLSLYASVYRASIDGTPAPTITSFSPTSGATSNSIVIKGTNFTNASIVLFNGAGANFVVNSSNQITAIIPLGATTGPISIITAGGLITTVTNFTVTSLPMLNAAISGTNSFVISWSFPTTGFVLQQNSNLATTSWVSVTNGILVTNAFNQIIIPFTATNNFFRLSSQ